MSSDAEAKPVAPTVEVAQEDLANTVVDDSSPEDVEAYEKIKSDIESFEQPKEDEAADDKTDTSERDPQGRFASGQEQEIEVPADEAAEKKADDKPSADQEGAAAEPFYPETLIRAASVVGMTDAQAKNFGSPAELNKFLRDMVSDMPDAKPKDQEGTQKPEEDDPSVEFKVDLGDDFDPAIQEKLNKVLSDMQRHYDGKFLVSEKQQQEMESASADAKQEADESVFDQYISGLGDDYKPHLGDAAKSISMDTNGKEFQLRNEVWKDFQSQQKDHPGLPLEKAFSRALAANMIDHVPGMVRKDIASKIDRRSRQTMGRATYRKSPVEITGEELAIQEVEKKLKEWG